MAYEDFLLRRAEFVLNEARCGFHERDMAITFVLRNISNHLTVGACKPSFGVKKMNPWMSKAARDLRSTSTEDEWHKATMNEHQLPLASVWKRICDTCATMTATELCDLLARYPFVTILREEDARLRQKEVRDVPSPEERYRRAGIEIVCAEAAARN